VRELRLPSLSFVYYENFGVMDIYFGDPSTDPKTVPKHLKYTSFRIFLKRPLIKEVVGSLLGSSNEHEFMFKFAALVGRDKVDYMVAWDTEEGEKQYIDDLSEVMEWLMEISRLSESNTTGRREDR